jgi:GNAT superfamily N-acetyltransferase
VHQALPAVEVHLEHGVGLLLTGKNLDPPVERLVGECSAAGDRQGDAAQVGRRAPGDPAAVSLEPARDPLAVEAVEVDGGEAVGKRHATHPTRRPWRPAPLWPIPVGGRPEPAPAARDDPGPAMRRRPSTRATPRWLDDRVACGADRAVPDTGDLTLRRATLDDILPLRHAVLRPGLPLEAARFDGDQDPATRHFAALTGADVLCCVSAMRRRHEGVDAWQVRGMATRGDLAGRGIGRALLAFATEALRAEAGPRLLWCNARVTALRFWERAGWRVVSDVFEIPGVGPHRVLERSL